jgi:hypothetical protein
MAANADATPALTITEQSGTNTLIARRGQRIDVKLSGLRWSAIVASDENAPMPALRRLSDPKASEAPRAASFVAEHPGTVRLSATGRANCQPGQACPHFVLAWSATIEVVE